MTLDDATGAIYSAFLVEEEGTPSTFRALAEVLSTHRLPCSLYTDRGSHYFHTPEAGKFFGRSNHRIYLLFLTCGGDRNPRPRRHAFQP